MTALREKAEDPDKLRAAMVDALRDEQMILSDAVAAAFDAVPRHMFAPGEPLEKVYATNVTLLPKLAADGSEMSVVSASHIQAAMLKQAEITAGMRVMEIGSGGYNAALIAELVGPTGAVTTVDIDADITARARQFLTEAGYHHVQVVHADAEHALADAGLFDVIIVTVGAWDIPPTWLEQLTPSGRIVVPLRFAGISRSIAFDRVGDGLVAANYRLGMFVPMQGDGAFEEQTIAVDGEVALRVDQPQPAAFDIPALRKAVNGPRIERWSGAIFDMPDELEMFLLTSEPRMAMLHVSDNMANQDVFNASARRGVPVLVEGGSFAYRIKRPNPKTGGYESGVIAHGPNAETLADRYLSLLRRWADEYHRRGAARIAYHPGTVGVIGDGWEAVKRHGTLTVTWP
ncbi:hypothetical protein GCM10010123_01770 [Pilimelia anulata]|uniref:Protein-L-isoaspartate O-methyltransferase n=1 Tax=Pilimelia anulata TaxID=53371 RepID=A0A8J3B681_9ACTN|nr:methyltransferase, FxLD system [Pilimelia anulata]GGJ75409.1 hypothetical protein GCM10010123_01770 [Pilimelia anulata]